MRLSDKREKINSLSTGVKIGILFLCFLSLPLIDIILIKVIKQEPIFTFQTKEKDNGNILEYYGFGYKLVKCDIDGETKTKVGFYNLSSNCESDAVVTVDTSREYSYEMSSIRGIPFKIECTKDLKVQASTDAGVNLGIFYKENDDKEYKKISTTCNNTFYFNPNHEVELFKDVQLNIQVFDGKNLIRKSYVVDYDGFFFRAYDDDFKLVVPEVHADVIEKIYEDGKNIYYLNNASQGYFVSYKDKGRISITDALNNHLVSIRQLINRGLGISIEEKQ